MRAPGHKGFSGWMKFRYLFLINLMVIVLLGVSLGREMIRHRSIQQDIMVLQEEADELSQRNLQIQELSTAMQTESFIEREARLKLGLKKPGEELLVIQVDEGLIPEKEHQDPLRILEEEQERVDRISNPVKWWYYFFNHEQFETLKQYDSHS